MADGIQDELANIFAGGIGVALGSFIKPSMIMLVMLTVCILAILIRKRYHDDFSEYWNYMFLMALPLGLCIGRILALTGVI